MRFADRYSGRWHEANQRLARDFASVLRRNKIDYRVLIDLHDFTPPSKPWREGIRQSGVQEIIERGWAEAYIDEEGDVVFTGIPHFQLLVPEYDKGLKIAVGKYLVKRQDEVPPFAKYGLGYPYYNPIEYLQWYGRFKGKLGQAIPAGLDTLSISREFDIGKSHVVVEFVPKVDYLENWRKGNVRSITIGDGYEFVKSLIDYFLENPYDNQPSIQ